MQPLNSNWKFGAVSILLLLQWLWWPTRIRCDARSHKSTQSEYFFSIFHYNFFRWFWAVCKVADNRLLLKKLLLLSIMFCHSFFVVLFFLLSLSLSSSLAIAATSTALFVFDLKKSMNFYLFIILLDSKSMFGWFGLAPLLSRLTTSNSHPFVYNIWPRCVYTMTVAIIECALILIFPPCQFFFSFVFFFIHLPFCLFSRRARI